MRYVLLAALLAIVLTSTVSAAPANEARRMFVTGYRACDNTIRFVKKCDGITASGRQAQFGMVACGYAYPFGTVFDIPGVGMFACYDRGGGINNSMLDIYMPPGYMVPGGSRWRDVVVRYDVDPADVLAGHVGASEDSNVYVDAAEDDTTVVSVSAAAPRAPQAENLLGYFVADILRAHYKADVALIHNAGLQSSLSAAELRAENVKAVVGAEQKPLKLDMAGRDIKRVIEYSLGQSADLRLNLSGVKVVYNPTAPEGKRLVSVKRADTGEDIWDGAMYHVLLTDSLYLTGGYTPLFEAGRGLMTFEPLADMARKWLTEHPNMPRPSEGRLVTN